MNNKTVLIRQPNINISIVGKSVILAPITSKEINSRYLNWLNDPEINEFLEVRHKRQTLDDIINYINTLRAKEGCDVLAIFLKDTYKHVGNIGITDRLPGGHVGMGAMIGDKRAQMAGVGAEALILFLEYMFNYEGVRRIFGGVLLANKKAQKFWGHLGFIKGKLIERYNISQKRFDNYYPYEILSGGWKERRQRFLFILKYMEIVSKKVNEK